MPELSMLIIMTRLGTLLGLGANTRRLTMGCCSSTVLSKSPCSQNSAATESATWVDPKS